MRSPFPALLVASTLVLGSAHAQTPDPTQIVRGLCQKDGCAEFAILEKQPVAKAADGELFRTRVETFHASTQGRSSQGEESGFVFCSPVRPAVISTPAGQPAVALLLAPDEPSPAYVLRASTNFFAIYFALCHGVEAGRAAALDRQGVARSFGYHVALAQPRRVSLVHPEDILKPPP